jgi:hypothetical protein
MLVGGAMPGSDCLTSWDETDGGLAEDPLRWSPDRKFLPAPCAWLTEGDTLKLAGAQIVDQPDLPATIGESL